MLKIKFCSVVGIALVGMLAVSACDRSAPSEPAAELNEEQLRGAKRTGVFTLSQISPQSEAGQVDYYEVELAPYESVELKYTAPENARIAFKWTSNGTVRSDFHAHPFEGGEELTESYDISNSDGMQGLYIAPFAGIHGWYWQNRTVDKVIVRLEASGGFTEAAVITNSSHDERPLNPEPFA